MKKEPKLKGSVRLIVYWPLFLIPFLLIMIICVSLLDSNAGLVAVGFAVIYLTAAAVLYFFERPKILGELVRFASDYGQLQRKLMKEMSIPFAVMDTDGKLLWVNDEFSEIAGFEKAKGQSVFHVFEGIDAGVLPLNEQDTELHIMHRARNYLARFRCLVSADLALDAYWSYEDRDSEDAKRGSLITMYLYDETEIMMLQKDLSDSRVIVGLIYIDNYEEALESIDEVRRSLLTALVDRKINKSMQSIDAIIRKLEKDKYICIFQNQYLGQLRTSRFPILDEVRSVNIGNEMSVTISIGLSSEAETFTRGYDQARAAIDLALGRGGDQVVLKERENTYYYGGKSVSVEKNTRVKARVKAHAFRELVESKDELLIMGHSIGDVDSLGSAIGVYRIAKTLNKKAHIIINEVTTTVRPIMSRFLNNADYEEDLFMNSQQAKEAVSGNTLVVLVDVNRANYSECPELLDLAESVVVLDHHRQAGEPLPNAVLSYIEPYASSACEMVAEILQYTSDGLKLRQAEADALYAGIMIDTNNFMVKTGVRTFEAAAYLRRNGADVTKLRKMFRTDITEYMTKASAVTSTEVYKNCFAFAQVENRVDLESPTVLAAQVANELLNITDIRASFVFTEFNGKVYISARSIDELNVQVVMEKFNGGGHMSVAGAQMSDCTVAEAMERVKHALDEMEE